MDLEIDNLYKCQQILHMFYSLMSKLRKNLSTKLWKIINLDSCSQIHRIHHHNSLDRYPRLSKEPLGNNQYKLKGLDHILYKKDHNLGVMRFNIKKELIPTHLKGFEESIIVPEGHAFSQQTSLYKYQEGGQLKQ